MFRLKKILRNSTSWSPQSVDESVLRRRSKIIPINIDDNANIPSPFKKPEQDEETIRKALLKNEFLSRIFRDGREERKLKYAIESMYLREVILSENLITEGQVGSQMFISASGKFEISTQNEGVIDCFTDNRVFGELSLLYDERRLATVTAVTNGGVWVLEQSTFQKLIIQTSKEEDEEVVSFLKTVEKLNAVRNETLKYVANLLRLETFKSGREIVKEGEKGDKFYIIRAGSVTVRKKAEGIVNVLNRGEYFGVLALLKDNDTRQATVIADPPLVECLTLTRKQFRKHFGKVEDITDITLPPQPQLSLRKDIEFGEIALEDLNRKAILGIGGFGKVELVQYRRNPKLTFALKSMEKVDIVKNRQQRHVFDETNIMMPCRSPFIVRLFRTYKDAKYVYLLMESCLGGDVFTLSSRQPNRRFTEGKAKFIAACVVEALSYLHDRGVIYRDLKPENLMIDAEGYIKLTDFGLSKRLLPEDKTYTFTGTHEYFAPEVIIERGYNKPVDYWTLGIFIFELLCGKSPFHSSDPSRRKLYDRIVNGINKVQFPTYMSLYAKHIVQKLCHSCPLDRLGCQRTGMDDVRNHRWFSDFNWKNLQDQTIVSPFKPKLCSNTDTRYFRVNQTTTVIPPDETSGWDKDF